MPQCISVHARRSVGKCRHPLRVRAACIFAVRRAAIQVREGRAEAEVAALSSFVRSRMRLAAQDEAWTEEDLCCLLALGLQQRIQAVVGDELLSEEDKAYIFDALSEESHRMVEEIEEAPTPEEKRIENEVKAVAAFWQARMLEVTEDRAAWPNGENASFGCQKNSLDHL